MYFLKEFVSDMNRYSSKTALPHVYLQTFITLRDPGKQWIFYEVSFCCNLITD